MGIGHLLVTAIGGVFIAAGLVLMLGGAIGVLRFPDFYTRLHAARVADGVGAVVLLLGLALCAGDAGLAFRVLLLAVLVMALGPTLTHLSASAAHGGGLAPLAGSYAAPRPGQRSPGAQS